MYGELSNPSYCTGYQSRAWLRSNTGSIALRDAEVHPPKVVATWSTEMSFCAFSAKVGQSEAPSSITGWICLPRIPPLALIWSIASSSAFLTVTSLMAMVPDSDCRMPTLTLSPEGSGPGVGVSMVVASGEAGASVAAGAALDDAVSAAHPAVTKRAEAARTDSMSRAGAGMRASGAAVGTGRQDRGGRLFRDVSSSVTGSS